MLLWILYVHKFNTKEGEGLENYTKYTLKPVQQLQERTFPAAAAAHNDRQPPDRKLQTKIPQYNSGLLRRAGTVHNNICTLCSVAFCHMRYLDGIHG